MKLIDKDALVAEIEKRKMCLVPKMTFQHQRGELEHLLSFINSLEVKEVDLEKKIDKYISDNFFGSQTLGFFASRTKEEPNDVDMALCAKHFFELGLSVNNPITAGDRGMAEEVIINLKRVEQDYGIDLTKEIEWLGNQVRKGE